MAVHSYAIRALQCTRATFERLMERVLGGIELSVALVYLDDILVHARSFEGHICNLKVVFDKLRRAGLKLSPKKCSLFRRQVRYLGHVLSQFGVMLDGESPGGAGLLQGSRCVVFLVCALTTGGL